VGGSILVMIWKTGANNILSFKIWKAGSCFYRLGVGPALHFTRCTRVRSYQV